MVRVVYLREADSGVSGLIIFGKRALVLVLRKGVKPEKGVVFKRGGVRDRELPGGWVYEDNYKRIMKF